MKLVNAADLTFKTKAELHAMIREATDSLAEMHLDSDEYAATVSSILIIRRALAARQMPRPKF